MPCGRPCPKSSVALLCKSSDTRILILPGCHRSTAHSKVEWRAQTRYCPRQWQWKSSPMTVQGRVAGYHNHLTIFNISEISVICNSIAISFNILASQKIHCVRHQMLNLHDTGFLPRHPENCFAKQACRQDCTHSVLKL